MEIFGHSWDAIVRAQQGGRLDRVIDTSKPAVDPEQALLRHRSDMLLLEQHGVDGLERLQYWGVLDRLRQAKVLANLPEKEVNHV